MKRMFSLSALLLGLAGCISLDSRINAAAVAEMPQQEEILQNIYFAIDSVADAIINEYARGVPDSNMQQIMANFKEVVLAPAAADTPIQDIHDRMVALLSARDLPITDWDDYLRNFSVTGYEYLQLLDQKRKMAKAEPETLQPPVAIEKPAVEEGVQEVIAPRRVRPELPFKPEYLKYGYEPPIIRQPRQLSEEAKAWRYEEIAALIAQGANVPEEVSADAAQRAAGQVQALIKLGIPVDEIRDGIEAKLNESGIEPSPDNPVLQAIELEYSLAEFNV